MATGAGSNDPRTPEAGITIRRLGEADAVAIRELAGRDSTRLPDGELLGLEVDGRLLAMQPLADGRDVIADPFAYTAEIRKLLELRTAQVRRRAQRQARRLRAVDPPEDRLHGLAPFPRAS